MATDAAAVLLPGPWEHRYVAANGARFHVAECGDGPLVLLVHGFPLHWWTWRHQLVDLAEAGYRAVALDLRGYGASDRPPSGYDAPNLLDDLAALIRSLGAADAVVVGHGIGGLLAWALPTRHPDLVRAVAAVSAPHPRAALRAAISSPNQARAAVRTLGLARPVVPERRLRSDPTFVTTWLRSAGADGWPPLNVAEHYARAMMIPFAAYGSLEAYRWLASAPMSVDGRAFFRSCGSPVSVPVVGIRGAVDPLTSGAVLRRSGAFVTGRWESVEIAGAGHFPQEEQPQSMSRVLLRWLERVG